MLGAGVGADAWLVYRAAAPRPASLRGIILDLDRPRTPAARRGDGHVRSGAELIAARLLTNLGDRPERRAQSLRLAERTAEQHALEKLVGAVGGFLGTALIGISLQVVGIVPPPAVFVVLAIAVAVGGYFLADLSLAETAEKRRRAFRHALSSYLDLVNVILAGGGGIETSLHAAAEAGDGWAFASIRRALDRARLTSRSPWDTFSELGEELGIDELRELAASVELAGSQGARIRASLAAKADSLRGHQIAETEAAAEAATERMTIPVAVLLFGFLVFIAYPAVQQITTVSNPVQ